MSWTNEDGCDVGRGPFVGQHRRVAIWEPQERDGKPGHLVTSFREDQAGNRDDVKRTWIPKHVACGWAI